jgi:hypothetical protein
MTIPSSQILTPLSLEDAIAQIALFTQEQFEKFRTAIESNDGFETETERLERLAPKLDVKPELLFYVLTACGYLYNRINNGTNPPNSDDNIGLRTGLQEFIEGFDENTKESLDKELLVSRLTVVLSRKERIDEIRKINRLRDGFIPNAQAFHTLLDLRPNFADGYESILGIIPVFQFRVTTDSDDEALQQIVFQIDENRLKKLKQVVENAEKKLSVVSRCEAVKPLMYLRKHNDDNSN